ncbi:hypothetical protein [Roseospira navarrensis]|uniref:Uncharacterized protein n=1 Tax=Roseospira navarrensis TaxID=140058 RepID=A0A7X1ZE84_9PROT|nr:hypothetical protein [Roseospira navarrensis]MQX36935.1 hypothetical protein [Roseospira navarrensis]
MGQDVFEVRLDLSRLANGQIVGARPMPPARLDKPGFMTTKAIEAYVNRPGAKEYEKAVLAYAQTGGPAKVTVVNPPQYLAPMVPMSQGHTFTLGLGGSGGIGIGAQAAAGFFGASVSPYFGVFYSVGGGAVAGAGIGGGVDFACYWRPPTVLGGNCYEITVGGGPGVYGQVSFFWEGQWPKVGQWVGWGFGFGKGGGLIVAATYNYGNYKGIIK